MPKNQTPRDKEVNEAWVDATLRSLSVREKIAQTAQERFATLPDDREETVRTCFEREPLGSVFVGGEVIHGAGRSAGAFRRGLGLCQRFSRVPLLVAGDLEAGAGVVVEGLTAFPDLLALGAADSEELAYAHGKFTALEGRGAAGFHWTFAPVVDLLRNWLNPVVTNRSLGARPDRVAALAGALLRGLQDHGLAACAKHFPGDGVDFRDQHLVTSVNSLSENEWWRTYGAVFEAAIGAGVWSIMSGHIALPWLEPVAAGQRRVRPASVSPRILTGLLRERMGFEGVIVSDALEMAGFTGWARYEARIVEAFNAGNDVMLWPGPRYVGVMERALADGRVSATRLDESVRRILTLKARLGLATDAEGGNVLPNLDGGPVAEARAAADRIAAGGVTLVRNDRGLLPLDATKIRRLLVLKGVSPVAHGYDRIAPLVRLLEARGFTLTVLENANCLDVWRREEAGERWDAMLAVFALQIHEMPNTVRPVGKMAEGMWTLQNCETLQPIVVSLSTPFLLRDLPFLETLVNVHSPCEASLAALDRALFGEAPFPGVSPVDVGGDWV